jgi:hypothetical protein
VPMWARFMKAATKGHKAEWVTRPRSGLRDARLQAAQPTKRSFWSRVFGGGKN